MLKEEPTFISVAQI